MDARNLFSLQTLGVFRNFFHLSNYKFLLSDVVITVVNSNFIHSGPGITFTCYRVRYDIIKKISRFQRVYRKIYADHAFGPSQFRRLRVVMGYGERDAYGFAKLLLLFYFSTCTNDRMYWAFAFLQYFQITLPISNKNRVLVCICLRKATEDEFDLSVNQCVSGAGSIKAEEWRDVVSHSSVMSVHLIVRWNYLVYPVTLQLPCPLHSL